jgi:glycosyltransferase involved in cell wall biosynthesis
VKVMVLGIRGFPNVQGGVETHAEHLYKRLADRGCDIEALVRTRFVPPGKSGFGKIRFRRLWAPKASGLEALVHSLIGVGYATFSRPDILHIHAIGPAIVTPMARLLGLRVVVTHHGRDYEREKWGAVARCVLRLGERFGVRYANALIVISQVIADQVKTEFGRTAHIIANGVARQATGVGAQHLLRLGLEPGKYVLQVSRMVPEKRQLDLIDAFAIARPAGWKLALVGMLDSDEYSQKVRVAAQASGTLLSGYLSGEPLREVFAHAGLFVLPSAHEGLPIALLEAMSYGLPVLASDIPAHLELKLQPSCYFPLGDTAAMARSIAATANAPADEAARKASRLWVTTRYDWDRIADQTLDVYRSVCASRHSQPR